jgi:hypothetical protein
MMKTSNTDGYFFGVDACIDAKMQRIGLLTSCPNRAKSGQTAQRCYLAATKQTVTLVFFSKHA